MSENIQPLRTGISSFDHHYGVHARGGDSWLCFGRTGSGKTNLACQTAGNMAKSGKQVLYITTKTDPIEVLMRAYSAVSSTLLADVKELKGSPTHPLAPAFNEWFKAVGKNITVLDYQAMNGSGFEQNYPQIIDTVCNKNGRPPDLTILDQISDVLGPYADYIQKLEACNRVASIVANTSKKLNNVAILLAPANGKCANKVELTMNDTADSKSLHANMSGVLGITSLLSYDVSDENVYRKDQYLVICKCREEHAMRLKVNRKFEMARFEGIG